MSSSLNRFCSSCLANKPVFGYNYEYYSSRFWSRRLGNNAKKGSKFAFLSSRKKLRLSPSSDANGSPTNIGFRTLIKPMAFTVCFSGCCFLGASLWQYENMRSRALKQNFLQWPEHYLPPRKRGEIRQKMYTWWNSQTEGQKIALVILSMNFFVFLLWRVPAMQPFMAKYFLCSPAAKANCVPMFLSTFSHYSLFHMAANMYVLYSFSSPAASFFGKEQFVAVYCSAGVISSLCSQLYKVATGRFITSLGASGALMAILSSMCMQFPNAILTIIFLPFITIPAGHAIKVLMTVDTIGLIAKWKLFDHASHLGGAIFGIIYLNYGRDYIWNKREPLMVWWHKIRDGR